MDELLFLTHRIPYPPNKGDKIRSFNLLKHLARRYRVHLGTFIDDPQDWRHVSKVEGLCGETCFVGLHPTWAKIRSASALGCGEPMTLPYYRNAKLQAWVDGLLDLGSVRRILVFSSAMGQYVSGDDRRGARRVIDFVDMDSDKWRQYSGKHPWPISWLYRREARTLLSFERLLAKSFDQSIFVSEAEAELFKRHAPESAARVGYVENGVDTDYFSPDRDYPNPYSPEEQVLVFTGAMDYIANVDAVDWFARAVFPDIHARRPTARFYIVGARPTKAVQSLAALPGVRVTGAVADIRPYLAHARAAVAPLRIARGVQNKVLEAMSMARPVLASRMAVEGIQPCPSLEAMVTESPAAMTQQALAVLCDDTSAHAGQRGRECVLRSYNWSENLGRIELLLEGDTARSPITGARHADIFSRGG